MIHFETVVISYTLINLNFSFKWYKKGLFFKKIIFRDLESKVNLKILTGAVPGEFFLFSDTLSTKFR